MAKIFIGNLAKGGVAVVTENDLKPLFELYGTVDECEVIKTGYGFVHMSNAIDARKAIRELDGFQVAGKKIEVRIYEQMAKIFVGNLAVVGGVADVTERDLKPLFEFYGTVASCKVKTDYGFVYMPNVRKAKKAIRELDGCNVAGRKIEVWRYEQKNTSKIPKQATGSELGVVKQAFTHSDRGGATGPKIQKNYKNSDDQIVQSKTICDEDFIESTKAIIKNRKSVQPKPVPAQVKPASISEQAENCSITSELQDCFFYQIMDCGRKSKCPFLHRTFPEEVCKLFMFKKCTGNINCPRQHLSPSSLPPPSDQEATRVRTDLQGREEVSQYVFKKKEAKGRSGGAKGSTAMNRTVTKMPASSSCFPKHLHSKDHWDRSKKEEKEMKGVVGKSGVIWAAQDVREKKQETVSKGDQYIHVCNIPLDMPMKAFRLICLQYGEVTNLTILPMYGDKAQHAYVRYSTREGMKFASNKLKKLQKCHFARATDMLIEKEETVDVDSEKSDMANVRMEEMTENLHHQSQESDQLLQLSIAREKLENKLLLCRIQLKTCNLNGGGLGETLKLLEEELEIKSKIRGLKDAEQQMIEPVLELCVNLTSQSKNICVDEDSIESTRAVIKERKSPRN